MAGKSLVIGSSVVRQNAQWQVWYYDDSDKSVVPLVAFTEKSKSDAAAFDAIRPAAKGNSPTGIKAELKSASDADPVDFSAEEQDMLLKRAAGLIKAAPEPSQTKCRVDQPTVGRLKTETDLIYVLRFN